MKYPCLNQAPTQMTKLGILITIKNNNLDL